MTGFRADGNGAGQRVRQAGYDQSGGGTQKTDAKVMSSDLNMKHYLTFICHIFPPFIAAQVTT